MSARVCVRCDKPYPVGGYRDHMAMCVPVRTHTRGPKPNVEREAAIIAAWTSGLTKAEIGRQVGLTRERVRQIIVRSNRASAAK